MSADRHMDTKSKVEHSKNSAASRIFAGALKEAVRQPVRFSISSSTRGSARLKTWSKPRSPKKTSPSISVPDESILIKPLIVTVGKFNRTVHSDVSQLGHKNEFYSTDHIKSYPNPKLKTVELPDMLQDDNFDKYKLPIKNDFSQNEFVSNVAKELDVTNSSNESGSESPDYLFTHKSLNNELDSFDLGYASLSSENVLYDKTKSICDEEKSKSSSSSNCSKILAQSCTINPFTFYKVDSFNGTCIELPGIKPPIPKQLQTLDTDSNISSDSSSAGTLKRKFSKSMSDTNERKSDQEYFTPKPNYMRTQSGNKIEWDQYREVNPIPAHLNSTPIEKKRFIRHQKFRYSFESSTPKSHYNDTSRKLFSSYNESKSAADQTPYSPISTPLSYKRLRTDSFLPHYNPEEFTSIDLAEIGFIDSHCHLDFLFKRAEHHGSFAEYRDIKKDQFPPCYQGCVAIFCDPFTFSKKSMWEPILQEDGVWAAFGCHPHSSKDYTEIEDEALVSALCHERVVALGEIGLDYSNRNNCAEMTQKRVFRRQLQLAIVRKLPLVIHCREAQEDCLEIMKEMVPANHQIHLHCFTDCWEKAKKWLKAFPRLFIGLTNVVTFASAKYVHEVARNIPLQRLLLETDTPYFLPRVLPRNLRWSHPGMAIHVAAQVAALKEITLKETLEAVRENTKAMYGI